MSVCPSIPPSPPVPAGGGAAQHGGDCQPPLPAGGGGQALPTSGRHTRCSLPLQCRQQAEQHCGQQKEQWRRQQEEQHQQQCPGRELLGHPSLAT